MEWGPCAGSTPSCCSGGLLPCVETGVWVWGWRFRIPTRTFHCSGFGGNPSRPGPGRPWSLLLRLHWLKRNLYADYQALVVLLKGEVARGYTCCEVGFPLPRPSSYRPPYNPSFHFIFHVVFYLILHECWFGLASNALALGSVTPLPLMMLIFHWFIWGNYFRGFGANILALQ